MWTDKTKASALTAFQPAHCRRMTRPRAQVPGTTWPRRSGTPRCRHKRRRMCLGGGARLYGAKAYCGNACSQTGKYRPSGLPVCIISSRTAVLVSCHSDSDPTDTDPVLSSLSVSSCDVTASSSSAPFSAWPGAFFGALWPPRARDWEGSAFTCTGTCTRGLMGGNPLAFLSKSFF